MERIKKALERARAERLAQAGSKPQSRGNLPAALESNHIEYEQTKVVPVSAKTLSEKRVIAGLDQHPALDAFKLLRTQVLQRMQENGWNMLAVTSPGPGVGKSLTSINLAVSFVRQYAGTVLLVDADLRRPSIHKYCGYEPSPGLTNHLLNGLPLSECLRNPGIERLVILPTGDRVPNTSELLRSSQMREFLEDARSRYDDRLIVVDLPPILVGDDALSVIPIVDCALLVIEDGKTQPGEIARATELLEVTHLIGSVLNKAADPKSSYYYY